MGVNVMLGKEMLCGKDLMQIILLSMLIIKILIFVVNALKLHDGVEDWSHNNIAVQNYISNFRKL